MAKIIGKFASAEPDLPAAFDEWIVSQDGYNDRLGLVPASVAPSTVAAILKEAESGRLGRLYELYDKMIATDARAGGISGSLSSTVSGLDIKYHAPKGASAAEEKLAADYRTLVMEAVGHPDFDLHSFIKDATDAYFYGVRLFQVKWKPVSYPRGRTFFLPTRPALIPGQRLVQEMQDNHKNWGELRILTRDKTTGKLVSEFDPRSLIMVDNGTAPGRYDMAGVLRRCVGWWLTKVYAQLWWAEWVESYGQPMRVGRYGPEATPEQKRALRNFLRTVGRNKWGIFPQGTDVQLKESTTQGNVTTFRDLIQMASNEMAVAIVGQTGITNDSAQGSRAKDEVAFEIRSEIVKDVAKIVQRAFERVISAILAVNYGPDYVKRLAPRAQLVTTRPESLEQLTSMFKDLANELGFPVSLDTISEALSVPMADAGELIIHGGRITRMPQDAAELKNGGSNDDNAEGTVPTRTAPQSDEGDESGDGEAGPAENTEG